jgi:hypothetical protein
VGLGEVEELLPRLADTPAEEPARAQGQPGLDDLKAAAPGIGPGVEEHGDAAQAIRRDPHRQRQQRQRGRGHGREVAPAGAAEIEHGEGDGHEREAGPEVRLGQDQRGQRGGHGQGRQEAPPHVAQLVAPPGQEGGQVDHQGQLGQLGGLERHRPQA